MITLSLRTQQIGGHFADKRGHNTIHHAHVLTANLDFNTLGKPTKMRDLSYAVMQAKMGAQLHQFRDNVDGVGNYPTNLGYPHRQGHSIVHRGFERGEFISWQLVAVTAEADDAPMSPTRINPTYLTSCARRIEERWPNFVTLSNDLAGKVSQQRETVFGPNRPMIAAAADVVMPTLKHGR